MKGGYVFTVDDMKNANEANKLLKRKINIRALKDAGAPEYWSD